MGENKVDFYVAIPSYSIKGDAIDENILESILEQINADQTNTKVVEKGNDFYVFSDVLPLNFKEVNSTIRNSRRLVKLYNETVMQLTKLVRNADRYEDQLNKLNSEIENLKKENATLKEKKAEALSQQGSTIDELKEQ